jgi:oligoribonuclease NrnB/cAMP/cGMP phosphodiesterase (DHH superfamily)
MVIVKAGKLPEVGGKIFVITHRRDFDGVSSAAQLFRKYGNSVKKVLFANYDDKAFRSAINTLMHERPKDSTVIITDLSAQDHRVEAIKSVLKRLKKSGNRIIWLDHHPWSWYALSNIAELADFVVAGENKDQCASELVFTELCSDDKVCRRLSELAHITDFNLLPRTVSEDAMLRKISSVITYLDTESKSAYAKMVRVTKEVSGGRLNGKQTNSAYMEYKASERENMKALKATMCALASRKFKIGIAFADNLQTNFASSKISELTGSKIQIFVTTKDGSAHVRSFYGIDCSMLSKALGGNGHPQASGFQVSKARFSNFSKLGRLRYAEMVRRAAARVYKTGFARA